MVLSALLTSGIEFYRACDLSAGDFMTDAHRALFDVAAYVANGQPPPILDATFSEVLRRRSPVGLLDGNFADSSALAEWLVDVWCTFMWLGDDMFFWAGPPESQGSAIWAGLAAAAKLRHLSARRAGVHAAMELLRDAIDPVGGAEDLLDRADGLGDMP